MDVTILAPAYNEEDVVEAFVHEVAPTLREGWEFLVVDDGSRDDTPGILRRLSAEEPRLAVVTHAANRGLGAALATGFAAARGRVIVTLDSDLSHPIDLIPTLARRCADADAVFASRYVRGGGMLGVPAARAAISRVANLGLRALFLAPVRDLTTGFRAYRAEAVRGLEITGTGFEAQLEITVRLLARGARILEVPFVLSDRAAGASKMNYRALVGRYRRTVLQMLRVRYGPKRSAQGAVR